MLVSIDKKQQHQNKKFVVPPSTRKQRASVDAGCEIRRKQVNTRECIAAGNNLCQTKEYMKWISWCTCLRSRTVALTKEIIKAVRQLVDVSSIDGR